MKKIFIGNDHRGYSQANAVIKAVAESGFFAIHVGCKSTDSADYPIFAQKAAEMVQGIDKAMAILICGSGIGVCIAANRFIGVRAATCRTVQDVEMTRRHNDANVLCLGADVSSEEDILAMVRAFLTTRFEGGRHQRRIDLIDGATTDGDSDFVIG